MDFFKIINKLQNILTSNVNLAIRNKSIYLKSFILNNKNELFEPLFIVLSLETSLFGNDVSKNLN